MNSRLEKILNTIVTLDSWDVGATLGALKYLCLQAAINQTVRQLPPVPEEEEKTAEMWAHYAEQLKDPEIRKKAAPFIGTADRIQELIIEYSTAPETVLEGVLAFMTDPSRAPKPNQFANEYIRRRNAGMKPDIPLRQFIEMEYAIARKRYDIMVAVGEHAVQILNQVEGTDEEMPEWTYDALEAKAIQKLRQRWERAEVRRTNDRIGREQRDLARANQIMIENAIKELGGEVPSDLDTADGRAVEETDDWLKIQGEMALDKKEREKEQMAMQYKTKK